MVKGNCVVCGVSVVEGETCFSVASRVDGGVSMICESCDDEGWIFHLDSKSGDFVPLLYRLNDEDLEEFMLD